MLKNLLNLAALSAVLAAAQPAFAEVKAVALFFNTALTNYTVPAGKVLLIEHLSATYANNTPPTPRIIVQTKILNIVNNGVLTSQWGYRVADKWESVTLARPLRIPAGGDLGIYYASDAGYNEVRMLGLLIDASDLYAANLEGDTTGAAVADGMLMAKVTLADARPARIASATSRDLAGWSANATGTKQRDANPRQWTVGTKAEGATKFLSVTAKAPEQQP